MKPVTPRALCGRKHAFLRFLTRGFSPARVRICTLAGACARARARLVVFFFISEEKIVNPVTRALAHDVGVVRRWDQTDRLCGTRVKVADRVHALLYLVCRQRGLIVEHDVVCRLDRALQSSVRLEVEVEVEDGRHALVDDGARARIPVPVGVLRVGREEPRVVALAAYDDAQHWVVFWILGVDRCECPEYLRQFVFENLVVLALDNTSSMTTIVKM